MTRIFPRWVLISRSSGEGLPRWPAGADITARDGEDPSPAGTRVRRRGRCRMHLSNESSCEHLFRLTNPPDIVFLATMSASKTRWCWRKDLAEFRGLSDRNREGFLLVLEWFENFRLRREMEASRVAAKAFWREEVLRDGRPREDWQLDQWSAAIQWYLNWLAACAEEGADHRSLAERVRGKPGSGCKT